MLHLYNWICTQISLSDWSVQDANMNIICCALINYEICEEEHVWCNTCLKYNCNWDFTHTHKHVCVVRAIFLQEYHVLILMSVQINNHTVSRFVHKDPSISYSNTLQHIPKKAIHHSIVILQRYTRQLYIFCGPSYLTVKQRPTTRRN